MATFYGIIMYMPIIVPSGGGDQCLFDRLEAAGVPLIDEESAKSQDFRPARIGLMNLMPAPAMEATEIQWLRWIGGQRLLQIEPVLIKFDDDDRERRGSSRENILGRYTPFSQAAEKGLDGLIITGDNLEIQQHVGLSTRKPLPFEKIRYYDQLREVVDWAGYNVRSTVYSCLAAHFALNYLHDLPRELGDEKVFGVYDHEVVGLTSSLMRGADDTFRSPHSRWGNTPLDKVASVNELKILAFSPQVGWLAIERTNRANGTDMFLQGHPEYDRLDLHREYLRDREGGRRIPAGYYNGDIPHAEHVNLTWSTDARMLHENWIGQLYAGYANQPRD